ncbi:4Fe-4S dicluster domain-containing protein [Thermodesulfobacteriota bacterium B35]
MNRRSFLVMLAAACGGAVFAAPAYARPAFLESPVTRNRLRPPGAVSEDLFAGRCIRCGRCVEVCPYRAIDMLDICAGLFAGTPLLAVEKIPCYLCMKCVLVCPTGTLSPVSQEQTRMGLAVINRFSCLAWSGKTLCRTCYDKCPFKNRAIYLDQLQPVIRADACTGCGLCTHACPVTDPHGDKAVNIEPIYSRVGATG